MDAVASWSPEKRADLFRDAADLLPGGVLPAVVEKDFWICWLLRRLFLLSDDVPMIFKGGTSLSKAYGVIRRLSEDIDISLDRTCLGFDNEGWVEAVGKNAKRRLLTDLKEAGRNHVQNVLKDSLITDIQDVLGPSSRNMPWSLSSGMERDTDLFFSFPTTAVTPGSGYLVPKVILEFGARGEQWPEAIREITPYAAEAIGDEFVVGSFSVRTLGIARTFWEKATILHSLAHGGPEKARERMARHYYDLVRLADAPESESAADDFALLSEVARHKMKFFPVVWAAYETARPGTLRLVPPDDVVEVLVKDYQKMRDLFMEDPPPFAELLNRLRALEAKINREG